jgi:GT2 family glycosyltransferase
LEDFFASISRQTHKEYILYLVDNSPGERSDIVIQRCLEKYPVSNYLHIKNTENKGVAAGNNTGIKKAMEDQCTHVLLLNNDIVIEQDDVFQKLIQLAGKENIITPKILFYDNRKIWTAGGYIDKFRGLGVGYGMGKDDEAKYNVSKYVTSESTCFMLINVDVFAVVGVMDENYFLYVDDTDFVYRATQKGYKVLYAPSIVILHKVSHSTGGTQTPFYVYYGNRNKIYFIRKNFKGINKFISLSYVLLSRVYFYFKFDRPKRKMLMKGVRDGFKLRY